MIKHAVLFAAGHEGEARQIGENRSRAILAVQPQQGALFRQLVRREVASNGRKRLSQFHTVAPIASVAKRAEPLVRMSLTDDGTSAHDLPALAPCVARGADVIESAKGCGQRLGLGQGALASRFPRAIHIKDHPRVASSIHQPTCEFVL